MKIARTPQQLDPLGTYAVWQLPAIAGAVAIAYAIAATLRHATQIVHAPLAVLGILLVVVACGSFVWASMPRRSPLSRSMLILVLVLAVLGSMSFTAATWGHNLLVQDDPGQIVSGVLLLAMSLLRPPRDLVIGGIAVAGVLGVVAGVQAGYWAVPVSPIVYGVVAATPPLALAFGSAVFARSMLRATERWQNRARVGMARLEPEMRDSVARSVQQEFVTVLNRDAAPLLEGVLAHGEITTADSEAAADIARQLRVQTVEALETSWLDDSLRRSGLAGGQVTVDADTNRRTVEAVTIDQRAVLGALLMAVTHSSAWTVTSAHVTVDQATMSRYARPSTLEQRKTAMTPARARLTLAAEIESTLSRRTIRRALMPYLSVLRVTSHDARMRIEPNRIEVGFSYDLA